MPGNFQNTMLRGGWTAGGAAPRKRPELKRFLARIPSPTHVAELGPEGGETATDFLENAHAVYRAFDVDPGRVALLEGGFARFPGRAYASVLTPNCVLPLPDQSQDLLLSCHVLEQLRMDQLYMLCSEARRIVRPGGSWLLASAHPGTNSWQRFLTWMFVWFSGTRSMELNHYISPEDWSVEFDEKTSRTGLATQYLLLRRLAG